MAATAGPPICRACGEIIPDRGGVVVVTVAGPGRPEQRLTICVDCARLVLRRLRAHPAGLTAAGPE